MKSMASEPGLNVLVFVLRIVFFHLIVYIVTRYMYHAVGRDFALSVFFLLECLMAAR